MRFLLEDVEERCYEGVCFKNLIIRILRKSQN